ncbi:MAG TPA: serine hydrolase, partial [Thermomicrobiales bacterium]|nr:serine hydrolase [Thermomicrobiales bacterium]
MTATNAGVVDAIEREFEEFAGTGGVAARDLDRGETIAVNADATIATASTIKAPILIELFRQVEAARVSLDDRYQATEAVRAPGSGILRDLSLDVELSVRDFATLMIVVSDNTATNLLIDLVGLDSVNRTLADLGFERTRLLRRLDFPDIGTDARRLAVTTPAELAGLMAALANRTILSPQSCDAILDIMRKQHYVDLTPRYLPFSPYAEELGQPDNGLRIANKTGGWHGMRADMALIEWPEGDRMRR